MPHPWHAFAPDAELHAFAFVMPGASVPERLPLKGRAGGLFLWGAPVHPTKRGVLFRIWFKDMDRIWLEYG